MLTYLRKTLHPTHPLRMVWYRLKGVMAALWYRFPARHLTVIGVTGTNGKTTTTHFIESILRAAGLKTALISTVEFRLGDKVTPNQSKLTTLSPFQTQRFLRRCWKRGVDAVVIEASSHALHQGRLFGIPFRIGVLTNITHEHLDYHGTMKAYRDAKKILFHNVSRVSNIVHKRPCWFQSQYWNQRNTSQLQPTIVLNAEDRFFDDFLSIQGPKKLAYGLRKGDILGQDVHYGEQGVSFRLECAEGSQPIHLNLPGRFNVENALAAASVGLAFGIDLTAIAAGLAAVTVVPGRQERFRSPRGFDVMVDFALTPDALEKLYTDLRRSQKGRLIGLIGSCGDRDKAKRPLMGRIVAEHTDICIVTDEEPYSEDPKTIMRAVLDGALKTDKKLDTDLFLIEDRYDAIVFACEKAQKDDLVVVTGMGALPTRTLNTGKIPWDERQVVREVIRKETRG